MKTKAIILVQLLGSMLVSAQNVSSIKLDGIDDHIYVGSGATFDMKDNLTLEAWVRCDSMQNNSFCRFIDKFNFVKKNGYNLILNGSHLFMEFFSTDGVSRNIYSKRNIQDNLWHHVAGTYDGKQLRIYIDGIPDNSKAVIGQTISTSPNPLVFGSSWDGKASLPLKGNIDEVRIWNIARDSVQIAAAKDSCLNGNETGLVGYWRFNEFSDTIARDQTIHKNHGKLRNGTTWSNNFGFNSPCALAGTVGIPKKTAIYLYPNPLSGNGILDVGDLTLPVTIQIVDMTGKVMMHKQYTLRHIRLESTYFKKGVYSIIITDGSGQIAGEKLRMMVR